VCGPEELLALAATLGRGPGPGLFTLANAAMLQGRAEREADLAWHERLAAASGRPVVVGPIFDGRDDPGGGRHIMDLTAAGRRPGVTVVPQVATRPFELWTRVDAPGLVVRALPTLHAAVRSGDARRAATSSEARAAMRAEGLAPQRLCRSNYRHAYWTLAQLVAHHTVGGCNLRAGDLLGTGTLSGPAPDEAGSLLELTGAGTRPIALPSGEMRTFLEDADRVILSAHCRAPGGARIGFGAVEGTVLPAPAPP